MDLFLSQPCGYAANLPRAIMRVAKLYRRGFLTDSSSVWINANTLAPIFWTYSHGRASCVWWFEAATAGVVRLSNGRIRWAPSVDGSAANPDLDINLRSMPFLRENSRLMFVVDHSFQDPNAEVAVYEKTRIPMSGGYYEAGPTAVLDLKNFDPTQMTEHSPTRAEYERGQLTFHGVDLLANGMNAAARADLLDNTDDYRYVLAPELIQHLASHIDEFDQMATAISASLFGPGKPAATGD